MAADRDPGGGQVTNLVPAEEKVRALVLAIGPIANDEQAPGNAKVRQDRSCVALHGSEAVIKRHREVAFGSLSSGDRGRRHKVIPERQG